MVTSTVSLPAHRTRRTALRLLGVIVLLLVLGAAVVIGWFFSAARGGLPQVDGQLTTAGLVAPVTVVRDARGVPNFSAASLEDLFFAQGFVTAQDRLWQMDMTRRFAAGELSEVLGTSYVKHDRQQRTLLVRQAAYNAAGNLTQRDRAFFEAYARGVNAYIAQASLPIEFRMLRYKPRPWTVTDSFLVASSMVQMLNLDLLAHELARERLSAHLTPELAADLFPNSSWRDHPPVSAPGQDAFVPPDEGKQSSVQAQEPQPETPPAPRRHRHARARHRAATQPPALPCSTDSTGCTAAIAALTADNDVLLPGSNNWVVSGAHTVSGKPLLSNDMHLGHQVPNVWYEAHLTSGTYDVAGVTLPGLPYVIAGHNQRIAWGFSNVGPAVADLFVETFNERGEYQTPDGWRQPEHQREVIHVKGGRDETVDVSVTRHGPIISGVEMRNWVTGGTSVVDHQRQIALRWTLYDPNALQVPFFDMNTAQNWDEFRRALSHFGSPAQNVVYADVDGHIGYQTAGMVPMRTSGDGALPVSGSDNSHEWTGYIPFEQLPSVFDPPSGVIATANGRITPDGYSHVISDEWGPPYRTERIYRVLGSDKKFAPADMLALQNDIYSDFDRFFAQRFVYAIDRDTKASGRARQAAEMMRAWDGRETTDSVAATAVAISRQELVRLLLQPRLGAEWRDYHWFMASVWLENLMLHEPANWLPSNYGTWNDLLAAAVEAAVNQTDAPSNLNDWRWGKEQPLTLRHPIFGSLPVLRRWAGPGRAEQSGNGYTVKQVGSRFGPSERLTVDFSDLDGSTLNLVNGQSGHIFSQNFNDQWSAWLKGTTFVLPFSPSAVEKAKVHQLVLEPKK